MNELLVGVDMVALKELKCLVFEASGVYSHSFKVEIKIPRDLVFLEGNERNRLHKEVRSKILPEALSRYDDTIVIVDHLDLIGEPYIQYAKELKNIVFQNEYLTTGEMMAARDREFM